MLKMIINTITQLYQQMQQMQHKIKKNLKGENKTNMGSKMKINI